MSLLKTFRRRPVWIGIALVIFGLAIGCSFLGQKLIEKPKVELDHVGVKDLTGAGATVVFAVKVMNPNPFAIAVDSLRYEVELAGKSLTSGTIDKPAKVGAKETGIVELPIPVKYSDLFSSALGFLSAGTSPYRVKGDASFGLLTIPFDEKGELKLSDLK